MKTKNYFWLACMIGNLFLAAQTVTAQETKTTVKAKTAETKIKTETKNTEIIKPVANENRVESLSGINLFPDRKTGNFRLRFSKALADSANLELKDAGGKILYSQALSPAESYTGKPMEIGKLSSGIYLIEVKSANTTYWKKVRVRN